MQITLLMMLDPPASSTLLLAAGVSVCSTGSSITPVQHSVLCTDLKGRDLTDVKKGVFLPVAREEAYRKYQLTINNPEKLGLDHQTLKTTLGTFQGCIYWCMCDEIGNETGTLHTHLYMAFRNAVMFQTIQQRFYGAHIEIARGSHRENREYLLKDGKWKEDAKHETSVPGTFEESGELPPERNARQKQSEAIFTMIVEGADNAEILREHPSAMNRLNHIEATRQTLLEEQFRKEFRELRVEYIWGETGVGKTRSVMEKYGYENVYRVTNYQHPFDGYRGQDVILFDEFRSSLQIADMLKYLDGYPVMLPCRYADRVACFTKVYLISNVPMEKQYPNIQREEPETWKAFLRRFNSIVEMLPAKPDVPEWAAF